MIAVGELEHLAIVAEEAARAGGRVVAERFGAVTGLNTKGPGDYVSDVDLASEAAIKELLEQRVPGIDFFGEEQGGERGPIGWLVDPLDGTTNFVHGFPLVGVSVALVADGRPVVGVVHAPLLDDTFVARLGGGAWRNGGTIAVSRRDPAQAICATGYPFRVKQRLAQYLPMVEAALDGFEDLRRPGAASLDLAWTAAGVFDGFFELGLGPWDVAAGALLIAEAGGTVTDWAGDPDAWLSSGDILCGPPAIHAVLLDLAASVTPRRD
ncbi:MAG: inositol monophosphatase family protein [Acidimicrobiia bacterium]